MKKIRFVLCMFLLVIALGGNAQTLTINTLVTMDGNPGSDPDDLYPTFFTEIASGIYEFSGIKIDIVAGAQVIMRGITIRIPKSGNIVVNVGASLIVEDCDLVGAGLGFHEYWGGIRVYGTDLASQYITLPFPWVADPFDQGTLNYTDFGVVKLIDGTKIMDASTGVYSNSGGIIQTRIASFEDCKRGVDIGHYVYEYLTVDAGNVSDINACKFVETTFTRYKNKGGLTNPWFEHCYLFFVKGINFHGCTFENITAKSPTYPDFCDDRGTGLYAIGSSFKLQNNGTGSIDPITKCLKYNGTRTCTFLGFFVGVRAEIQPFWYFDTYTMAAENVVFNDCVQGAAILNGDHHVFASCTFNNSNLTDYIDASKLPFANCNQFAQNGLIGGLFFGGAREIIVTNCTFLQTKDIGTGNAFLILQNMGNYSSFIYKNSFTNTCSSCTKGLHPVTSISGVYFLGGTNKGTQVKCNIFNDNHYSIVFDNSEVPTIFSGGPNTSTGNKFYGTNNEIWDEQTNAVNYIYNSFDPAEFVTAVNGGNNNSHSVTFTSTTGNETSCPGWDCKGWPLSNADIDDLDLAVFPNPANDLLNIQLDNNALTGEYSVQVMDVSGRVFYVSYSMEGDRIVLDVSSLSTGMYLVRLQMGEAIRVTRFIKE